MGRNAATINYATGSLFGNTFNMYLCGSATLTLFNFLFGLVSTGTIEGAAQVAFDFFVSKFTPFPFNELLVAGGIEEFILNVIIAVTVGIAVSSFNYWRTPGSGASF